MLCVGNSSVVKIYIKTQTGKISELVLLPMPQAGKKQETRTRNSHIFKYRVPRVTKDIFKYSFYPRTLTEWNSLPKEIVLSETLDVFKSKLENYIK